MGNGINTYDCRKCGYNEEFSRQKTIKNFNVKTEANTGFDCPGLTSTNINQTDCSNLEGDLKNNLIESYDSSINFFYYIKKVTLIQRRFRRYIKTKRKNVANMGNFTQVDTIIFMRNDHEKENIDNDNEFDYNKFSTLTSCMKKKKDKKNMHATFKFSSQCVNPFVRLSSNSLLKKNNDKIKQSESRTKFHFFNMNKLFKKDSKLVTTDPSMSPEKNPKVVNEGCSLTKYMTQNFGTYAKVFTNKTNGTVKDSESRGCFFTKIQSYKYQGNVDTRNNQKEGFGKMIFRDHSIVLSYFHQNFAEGITFFNDKPEDTEFYGYYHLSKPDGYGIFKQEGVIQEGDWKNNQLNGIGREYSESDTYYQGDFENCAKHGIGIYRWSDGTIYKGEWVNNQMTGFGLVIYNDDKIYIGEVSNGAMHGYGEFYWGGDGKKYFGFYENDVKSGFGTYVWSINPLQAYVGFWEKGKMNGIGVRVKGSKVKYGHWKNGKNEMWLQGAWELRKHISSNEVKYIKLLERSPAKIINYIHENLVYE